MKYQEFEAWKREEGNEPLMELLKRLGFLESKGLLIVCRVGYDGLDNINQY